MKNRIISFVLALTLIVSALLGTTVFASAEGSAEYKNTALNLAENITVKIQVAIAAPGEGDYAKVTLPGGKVVEAPVAGLAKLGDDYVIDAEVAVKDFAKDVKFEICSADGTAYFEKVTSAAAYCDAYAGAEYAALVDALEVYAAAAAAYFEDGEAVTVDADIPAKEAKFSGTLPAGLTHKSATLVLESETTVRHYFVLAEGKLIENYKFFVDLDKDGALDANEALTANKKTNADGDVVYYVDIDGITPNELDVDYTVGAYGVADKATYTCTYGALTYAASKANANAKLANLVKALYNYNAEAGKLKGTVTFNANGGSEVVTKLANYEYGVETPIIASTTKAGHRFVGWFDANGNKYETIPSSQTGALSLKAVWSKIDVIDATWGTVTGNTNHAITFGDDFYDLFFYEGIKLTNEVTLSVDLTNVAGCTSYNIYFRHVAVSGTPSADSWRVFHTYNAAINQTGTALSNTEPTNLKCVYDLNGVVANDGVADVIPISYYVNDEFVKTVDYTLPCDISGYVGRNYFMQISWRTNASLSIENLTVKDTSTNKVAYPADATLPEGTVTEYTPGTALPLAETATKAGAVFGGWYADAALTKPVSEVPANATGTFKVYAKWNNYINNNQFDADYAGFNPSVGNVPGSATVIDGVLHWNPKADNGNGPTLTHAGAATIAGIPSADDCYTYRFELGRDAEINPGELTFRLIDGIGSGATLPFLVTNAGGIKTRGGKVISALTEELVAVDVVFDFTARTVSYYVDGLFVVSEAAGEDVMTASSNYTNAARCLNIRCGGKAEAYLKFGYIEMIAGNIYA